MISAPQPILKLGTRGSPLALAQSNDVKRRLVAAHAGWSEASVEIVVIKTTGDRIQDRALSEAGGKGLFTKELEDALLDRRIDLAVHSMKDVPTALPGGLGIVTILQREDVRDVLIARGGLDLAALAVGALVGTASLRRQAQVLARRPDLRVVNFRGNVETRLRKLDAGEVDATFLALAGLKRLGMADKAQTIVPVEEMLPAVAQGAVGIEARLEDRRVLDLLAPLHHDQSAICVTAERAMLAALDGSCRTPIAGLGRLEGERLHLVGEILTPDGRRVVRAERMGTAAGADALGRDLGDELRRRGGPDFFRA